MCAFVGCLLLARDRRWAASASLMLIGAAALVGTIRFASGEVERWRMLHQFLSQQGGLLAITLMTLSVVTDRASLENNQARAIAVAGLLAIGALLIYGLPAQAVISSGLLLTIAATILATWTGWRRSLGAGLFLLVFANGALVRQSDFLSAPAAWHIYHGLLSVFALGYTRLFSVSAGYPPAKDAQQAH